MQAQKRNHRILRPPRAGFTLVELLVVLAIIGLVISITAATAMRVLSQQKATNTNVLIRTLSAALNQHWMAVVEQARKESPDAVLGLAGDDVRRAQVTWIKLRLKQEFPMTFAEAVRPGWNPQSSYNTSSDFLPGLPAYRETLISWGIQAQDLDDPRMITAQPQPCEMAACLLMALQRNRKGVNYDAESLPSGYISQATYTTVRGAKVTVPCLVDGWQKPLGFFRWPTGNAELNPGSLPSVGFNDALDPEGLLCNPTWVSAHGAVFGQMCHAVVGPDVSGAPQSFKLQPVIASAGSDNSFPDFSSLWASQPAPQAVTANPMTTSGGEGFIYSYNLASLGARGDQ